MKNTKKTNIPDNLSSAEQLKEFREKHPLIYAVEAKKGDKSSPTAA